MSAGCLSRSAAALGMDEGIRSAPGSTSTRNTLAVNSRATLDRRHGLKAFSVAGDNRDDWSDRNTNHSGIPRNARVAGMSEGPRLFVVEPHCANGDQVGVETHVQPYASSTPSASARGSVTALSRRAVVHPERPWTIDDPRIDAMSRIVPSHGFAGKSAESQIEPDCHPGEPRVPVTAHTRPAGARQEESGPAW